MENKEKKFNEAKKLHQAGKVNEAQKIYIELLKNSPSDHKINFLTGTSYLQLKNYEKAITYLDNSINISPEFPHSYNSKGIVFSEMKFFEEAIRNYDKAILLKPDCFFIAVEVLATSTPLSLSASILALMALIVA